MMRNAHLINLFVLFSLIYTAEISANILYYNIQNKELKNNDKYLARKHL